MSIDDDCGLGYAQALTYLVFDDNTMQGYLQAVECCAYPGTGRVGYDLLAMDSRWRFNNG